VRAGRVDQDLGVRRVELVVGRQAGVGVVVAHAAKDRPSLFGVKFDGPMLGHEAGMPIHHDLHLWLWKHNPSGLFAMWNPRVHCPK
jgi:hypothetical protein